MTNKFKIWECIKRVSELWTGNSYFKVESISKFSNGGYLYQVWGSYHRDKFLEKCTPEEIKQYFAN